MSKSHIGESKLDLRLMRAEFERAMSELEGVPDDLYRYKREQALSSPLSRLDLVRRTLAVVLKRHGWLERQRSGEGVHPRTGVGGGLCEGARPQFRPETTKKA